MKICDLHLHLNGSFSEDFLRRAALKNNRSHSFAEFKELHRQHHRIMEADSLDIHKETIAIVWQKFALIHEIIGDLDDIREGTVDVVLSSEAEYLEVRSTPKPLAGSDLKGYATAFAMGIQEANARARSEKANGILSIDRTRHDCTEGVAIVELAHELRHQNIVGIDICGNPEAERTLKGEDLVAVIDRARRLKLGISIHCGESPGPVESADLESILNYLEAWWEEEQDPGLFKGRVRLGHAIYMNARHQDRIVKMRLPIEICPTCHLSIRWWDGKTKHPVLSIYDGYSDPVVLGTDDSVVFNTDIRREAVLFSQLIGVKHESEDQRELFDHHYQYRF